MASKKHNKSWCVQWLFFKKHVVNYPWIPALSKVLGLKKRSNVWNWFSISCLRVYIYIPILLLSYYYDYYDYYYYDYYYYYYYICIYHTYTPETWCSLSSWIMMCVSFFANFPSRIHKTTHPFKPGSTGLPPVAQGIPRLWSRWRFAA